MVEDEKLEALAPCPFCGEQPEVEHNAIRTRWVVFCGRNACGLEPTADGKTEAQAVAAWNRRPAPSGEVEARLREALGWYAEQVEGCRKLGSIGEPFRNALDRDGGKRAQAALTPANPTGSDKP